MKPHHSTCKNFNFEIKNLIIGRPNGPTPSVTKSISPDENKKIGEIEFPVWYGPSGSAG